MIKIVIFAAVAAFHLSNQVMGTIERDGVVAGMIHFMFCLLLIEVAVKIIEDRMTNNSKPKNKIIRPSNEYILAVDQDDIRLDTGMTAKEAIERARIWWGKVGRKQMKHELMRQSTIVGGSKNGAGAAFASKDKTDPNFLPSGIIHGEPWDALTKRERLSITKIYHHFSTRNRDLIGLDDDEVQHKMHDRNKIN